MRSSSLSVFFMVLFSMSVLFITGCDTREEKVEILPEIEGDLLTNGRVAPVSPEGAAELKEMISNISIVKQYTDLFEQMSEQDVAELTQYVEFRGEFDVIPRTNNYEVVFPDRTTILPHEGEQFESIQLFHPIKLRVTPTGDPAAFRVAFEMDEKPFYAVLNKDGKSQEFFSFTYEPSVDHEALWHNDLQMFAQLTGSMQNVLINLMIPEEYQSEFDNIDGFKMSIANVRSDAMLEPDENNIWSGRYNSDFDNIEITLPQQVGVATILKMSSESDFEKLDPVIYRDFFAKYDELLGNLYEIEADDTGADEIIEFLPVLKAYKDLLVNGFKSSDMVLTATQIDVKLNKTPDDPHTEKSFGLKEASFSGSMKGAHENKAEFNLAYTLKGIDVGMKQFEEEFGGETPQEMVPNNVSFGFGFKDLPAITLMDKAIEIFEQSGADEDKMEAMFEASQGEFIKILSEAGTKADINNTYVGNDIWLLLVNGSGNVNETSPFKVAGETEVRFYGMDYLMQIFEQRIQSPDTAPGSRMMLEQALGGLGMMQLMGQQKKDDNGRDYRGYTVTLTPEGQSLLNGTDMNSMMGMMR
jgi:hypothetical protein